MTAPLLVIAAGGTGGHMFPAQALAEEMLARGWRVTLATDARGIRYANGFPKAVERRSTAAATVTQGSAMERMTAPFAIASGAARSLMAMHRDRPAVAQAGVDQLVQVMGRNVRRHADGNAGGAVRQQVGKRRRHDDRLLQGAVIVRAEVDRVLGQPFH